VRRRGALTPYLFLLPGLLLFGVFRLYPLLDGLRLSFTNARLGRPQYAWVGLANYARLLDDTRFRWCWRSPSTAACGSPRCSAGPSSFRSRSRW
jgi:ABC-type sugar transport system permease subunit